MSRFNRREFLGVLSGAAIPLAIPELLASTSTDNPDKDVTALYVKGLVLIDLGSPEVIRLGFPKAPGHKGTLSYVPHNGAARVVAIKGKGFVEAKAIAANSQFAVPELIRMKEFYGENVKARVDDCPTVISIPRNAIRSVVTTELSPSRYTFVRSDTGTEVTSFRPRQVADAIKIELSSAGTLKLDGGKMSIPLDSARELRLEYSPERAGSRDPFAEHFHHFFPYIDRPAALDFDVVPRKLGAASSPTPHVGHNFMMLDHVVICGLAAVP